VSFCWIRWVFGFGFFLQFRGNSSLKKFMEGNHK
jgi:hypothetical protein